MKKQANYRKYVQFGSLILYNPGLFSFKYCPVPGMNCYACPLAFGACPIGSLQHFMVIKRVPYLLMGFFMIIGAGAGRMACGWACPIGWLQEVLYKMPVPKIRLKGGILKYLKYFVLVILVLLIPFVTGEPWFSKLCFVGTLEGGIPLVLTDKSIRGLAGGFFLFKLGLTALLLLSFILVKRPFCRFICPLGAIYSLFNRVSYLRLNVDEGCTKCDQCLENCPMGIKVYENPNSTECIRCLECTSCAHVHVQLGAKRAFFAKEEYYDA